MAGFAEYLENKVLDHITGKLSYTMPTAYVALYTVAPTDTTPGTEVTGGSYERKVTSGATWTSASAGATSNAAAITFVTATANWGTIVAFSLMDAATSGNMLCWGTIANKDVDNGDTASFAIGELDITLD